MNDDQKQPPRPDAVKSYAGGIQARTAQRAADRAANTVLPNLAQATVGYDPRNPQTLEQIGRQQRADEPPAEKGLSSGVVDGLKAIHDAHQKHVGENPSKPPAAKAEEPEPDAVDQEFMDALDRSRQDVIQNERERAAVAARCQPIDLSKGLLDGAFEQLVPIVPGKLDVRYRCLTPFLNNEIRMILYADIVADPRKERLVSELLSLYQTVATTIAINKTSYADIVSQEGPMGAPKLNEEVFRERLSAFQMYPVPLIIALSTHSAWFEMRVRELFATSESLKNG